MVSDQEIARSVESLLRQTDPNSVTTLSGVVQQLEVELGLDLSHKAGFIRDQINLLLRSHPQQPPQPPSHLHHNPQKDHFALQNHPQYQTTTHPQQFPPHFALHRPESHMFAQPRPSPVPQPHHPAQSRSHPQVPKQPELFAQTTAVILSPEAPRESAPAPAKRKGGPGGLNKVCGVSPELQAIVGEAALPRTEIVKQLWAYIRKNNLQDPSNKRKIICDDALRVVFETDCTDMFKMNKLLAKHIIALGPTKESSQAKRAKVDVETSTESTNPGSSTVIISEALAKFLSSSEREMPETEASSRVWEHVKVNNLEDPMNSMIILCDAKLRELLGCESISALGIQEMLNRHHIFKQS